jgi:HNH endonuclease
MDPETAGRYFRQMQCRRCRECQHVLRPSSGHLRCPACRSKSVCACGRSKQLSRRRVSHCRSVAADANGNWKGGRTRHKAGYVMVRAPDHPRASSGPYVFEHILDLLGRYLHDGETVHHRNGVRHDNRPENLELWTIPQPSGIRVSDAIGWAHEILERYAGVGAPPTAIKLARESPWRWRGSNRPRPECKSRCHRRIGPLTRVDTPSAVRHH